MDSPHIYRRFSGGCALLLVAAVLAVPLYFCISGIAKLYATHRLIYANPEFPGREAAQVNTYYWVKAVAGADNDTNPYGFCLNRSGQASYGKRTLKEWEQDFVPDTLRIVMEGTNALLVCEEPVTDLSFPAVHGNLKSHLHRKMIRRGPDAVLLPAAGIKPGMEFGVNARLVSFNPLVFSTPDIMFFPDRSRLWNYAWKDNMVLLGQIVVSGLSVLLLAAWFIRFLVARR